MKHALPPMSRWFERSRQAALDLLFPPRCTACGGERAEQGATTALCDRCRTQLPLVDWPVCARCAAPVPSASGVELPCSHCRGARLRFTRTLAMGSYEGLLRKLVMRMKTERSGTMARTLAELAWRQFGERLRSLQVDAVTAVPMHRWRRWQRGVDPPRLVAERLAFKLGVPAAGGVLRLRRNVQPQIGLSRPARFRNIHGEMIVGAGYHLEASHVLLVDDILTTGATCSEAARVLLLAGAAEVSVLVLARTPAGD